MPIKRETFFHYLPLAFLLGAAFLLYSEDIGSRPMHTDEAVHGYRLGLFLQSGEAVEYDPVHFHGPVLYQISRALTRFAGQGALESLEEDTLRTTSVFGGLALIAAVFVLGRSLGPRGGFLAGLLVLLSPGLFYYSRYFIAEIWFIAFTWWAIWAAWRWLQEPSVRWAIAFGALLGLIQATKETILVVGLVGVLALVFVAGLSWARASSAERMTWMRRYMKTLVPHAAIGVAAWLFTAFILFTDFLQHPAGFADAFRAYVSYELVEGHEKPFLYYLRLLAGRFGMEHGVVFAALVGVGFMAARARGGNLHGFGLFVLLFTVLQFLAYSFIGYKVPWLILGVIPGLCLLGGVGLKGIFEGRRPFGGLRALGALAAGVALVYSLLTALQAAFVDPVNLKGNNPYAYVHTHPDIPRLAEEVERLAFTRYETGYALPIQAYGFETWPLPWYFKAFPNAQFSPDRPESLTAPVIIQVPDPATGLEIEIFSLDYSIDVGTLRPGAPYVVFMRRQP